MTAKKYALASSAYATTHEIYFLERGIEAHEFNYIRPGSLRPIKHGWYLIGELKDEAEYNEFIDYCEAGIGFNGKIRLTHVRYSWANWKRYKRKARAPRPGPRNRR